MSTPSPVPSLGGDSAFGSGFENQVRSSVQRRSFQRVGDVGDGFSKYSGSEVSSSEWREALGQTLPYELVFADPEDLRSEVVNSLVGAVDDFDTAYSDFLKKRQACLSWKASYVPSAPVSAADSGMGYRFQQLQSRWKQLCKETDLERYYARWGIKAEDAGLVKQRAADVLIRGEDFDSQVQDALDELYGGLDVRAALGTSLGALEGGAPLPAGVHEKRLVAGSADLELGFLFTGSPPLPVAVSHVDTGSWAHRAGVEVGDALLEVNGTSIEDMSAAYLAGALVVRPTTIVFKGRVWKSAKTAEQAAAAAQREALESMSAAAGKLETWLAGTLDEVDRKQTKQRAAEEEAERAMERENTKRAVALRKEVGFFSDDLQVDLGFSPFAVH